MKTIRHLAPLDVRSDTLNINLQDADTGPGFYWVRIEVRSPMGMRVELKMDYFSLGR